MAAVNRAQWLAFSGEYSNAIEELEILLKRGPDPTVLVLGHQGFDPLPA